MRPLSRDNPIIKGTPQQPQSQEETADSKKVAYHITIQPEALKQRFLFKTYFYSPWNLASDGGHLAAKVVFFRKQGNRLFMFEETQGRVYTDTIQTNNILGRFDIVEETATGEITFNFQDGMTLMLRRPGFVTLKILESGIIRPHNDGEAFKITHSYVEKVDFVEDRIIIDQTVRGEALLGDGSQTSVGGRMVHSLSTYLPNENFQPTFAYEQEKVGFFLSPPLSKIGEGIHAYIVKPDASKTMTFYLDSNIPKEFHQAFKDGILYWNGPYNKEMIKVELLPEDMNPDYPGINVISWLNFEDAIYNGFTNVTSDPLTGELLFCRLYINSRMGRKGGRFYTEHHINRMDLASSLDQRDMGEIPHLTNSEGIEISERLSADEIRWLVAHEMGHCLGLGHNFAASTQTTLTKENYEKTFREYLYSGDLPEKLDLSSSVMDYLPSNVGAMVGAHIRLKRPPLSYDVAAVGYSLGMHDLFFIDEAFCTNADALAEGGPRFGDCRQRDTFENSFAWFEYNLAKLDKIFPLMLLSEYGSVFGQGRNRGIDYFLVIKNLHLAPRENVQMLFSPLITDFIKTLLPDAEFARIRKDFYDVKGMNEDGYRKETRDFINENVEKLGGISQILLKDITPVESDGGRITLPKIDRMMANFDHYLPRFGFILTPYETAFLRERAKQYFKIVEREILLQTVRALKTGDSLIPQDREFAGSLAAFAKGVLFSKTFETLEDSNLQVPLFDYQSGEHDLRQDIVSLLAHNFYPHSPSYMKEINKLSLDILETHKQEMDELLSSRPIEDLPNALYDWAFFEQKRFSPLLPLMSVEKDHEEEVVSKVVEERPLKADTMP